MTTAMIARFSQTGATAQYAERIAGGLRQLGWEVDIHEITPAPPPDVAKYDVIGIGSPTYVFRPPYIVTDFVRTLPALNKKASFVFITYGTIKGASGNRLRTQLKAKGGRDLGYFAGLGADYFLGYLKRGILFAPDSPTSSELAETQAFASKLVQRYAAPRSEVEPYDGGIGPVFMVERALTMPSAAKLMLSHTYHANDKCVGCGTCVENCPMGNIEIGAKNKPVFHSNCLLCSTCELGCPQDAIRSAFDWPIFAPFMAYNLRHSKKEFPYIQVEHKGGKTHRL